MSTRFQCEAVTVSSVRVKDKSRRSVTRSVGIQKGVAQVDRNVCITFRMASLLLESAARFGFSLFSDQILNRFKQSKLDLTIDVTYLSVYVSVFLHPCSQLS